MRRRAEFPSVPLGALGFEAPTVAEGLPKPSAPIGGPEPAYTRGVDGRREPILGGAPAAREAAAVMRASVASLKAAAADADMERRKGEYWRRIERGADDSMKKALALSVLPTDDETDEAYEARLTAIFENLRLRLDPIADATLLSNAPAPTAAAPAQAHVRPEPSPPVNQADLPNGESPLVTPPTGPSGTNALPLPRVEARSRRADRSKDSPLLRKEMRQIRQAFWARNHRSPTEEELTALVTEYRGDRASR